jgi:hypothetical protein
MIPSFLSGVLDGHIWESLLEFNSRLTEVFEQLNRFRLGQRLDGIEVTLPTS